MRRPTKPGKLLRGVASTYFKGKDAGQSARSTIKRRIKKYFGKFTILFLVTGLTLGLLQSYNQTEAQLKQERDRATQSAQEQRKAQEAIKQQLDDKTRENSSKDAQIKLLEEQLQAKRAEEVRIASLGRGGLVSPVVYGNDYAFGNCTFFVAGQIKVPAGLGNANAWDDNARALGYVVTSEPRVGAVAQTDEGWYGHVALVTAVDKDSVHIREMNYVGYNVVSERDAPQSDFRYIYF